MLPSGLVAAQAAAVELLDAARAGPAPPGTLAPRAVRPYLAELQDARRLVQISPAVFVELSAGELSPLGAAGSLRAAHVITLVCVARNAAGRGSAAHDGARLMDWALAALQANRFHLGRRRVAAVQYRRLLSDKEVWAGRLDLTLAAP